MTTFGDIDPDEPVHGPLGTVEPVQHPSVDEPGLTARARAALGCSLGTWLITAPVYHPIWSQYVLSVIRLVEHPDLPPPMLKFLGATHEMLLFAVSPESGTQTPETMTGHCRRGDVPMLQPVNICEQFIADDDEMRAVAWLAARGAVHGLLNPETGDAPARIRAEWLVACTKTLAHLRGETHAP